MDSWQDLFKIVNDIWKFKIVTLPEGEVTTGSIVISLLIFIAGLLISRMFSRRVSKLIDKHFDIEKSVVFILETLSFYVLLVISLFFALRFAHIPLTIFTVIGGAVAIGVGFGSQNLVNNFLSGLIMMFEQPVKVGDFVEVDNTYGEVEEIGFRSTNIRTVGNHHIIVPNSSFLEKNVLNWTRKDNQIVIKITVGVAYGSDTEKVKEGLIEAVKAHPRVLQGKEIMVYFEEFADNSLNFEVVFWSRVYKLKDQKKISSDIRFSIDKIFREKGIVIAFPQRDLHVDFTSPLRIEK